jgi:lambda family phage tail tape measure protein
MATVDNYQININVKGDADLKMAATNVDSLGKKITTLSSTSKSQLDDMGVSSRRLGDNLSILGGHAEKLVTAFAGLGAIELVKHLLESSVATEKLSEQFGISVEHVLDFQAALRRLGVDDAGAAAKGLTILAGKLDELTNGNLGAIQAFKTFGLTFDIIKSKQMSYIDIIKAMGESEADGTNKTAKLVAQKELLGKALGTKDLIEFSRVLTEVEGTNIGAAKATKLFAEAQENIEQGQQRLKSALLETLAPLATFLSKLTIFFTDGDRVKTTAEAIAHALEFMAGRAIIGGVNMLAASLSGVAASSSTITGSTQLAAASVGKLTLTLQQAVLEGNLYSAGIQNVVKAETELTAVQERLNALQNAGLGQGEAYIIQQERLAAAIRNVASAKNAMAAGVTMAAGVGAVAGPVESTAVDLRTGQIVAAEAATVGIFATMTKGFNAVVGTLGTIFEWVARIGGRIFFWVSVAMLANDAIKLIFKVDLVDKFLDKLKEGYNVLAKFTGLTPFATSDKQSTMTGANEDKLKKQQEEAAKAAEAALQNKIQLDQLAKIRTESEAHLAILKSDAKLNEDKLKLQQEMVGLSALDKVSAQSAFDFTQKQTQETTKLTAQIKVLEIEKKNAEPKERERIQTSIDGLIKERTYWKNLTDTLTPYKTKLEEINQSEATRLAMLKISETVSDNVFKTEQQIADLTATSSQQKINAIKQAMDLEATQEIRRREALLGAGGTLGEQDKLKIIEEITKKYDPLIAKQTELNATSRSFSTGWQSAFTTYMDDATNAAKMAGDIFNTMTNSMNSAIDNFVTTGKFSFKDFATSIIMDIEKMMLKMAAMQVFSSIFGATGTGGIVASLFGLAEGGPANANQPYIVGEKGPELFVPNSSGTIIPNGATGSASNGASAASNTYITNNISALDSQSVAQLFATHRKMLLGTIQMAQKEMPYANI